MSTSWIIYAAAMAFCAGGFFGSLRVWDRKRDANDQ